MFVYENITIMFTPRSFSGWNKIRTGLIFVILLTVLTKTAGQLRQVRMTRPSQIPHGACATGSHVTTLWARSKIHCAVICSEHPDCNTYSVLPQTASEYRECRLYSNHQTKLVYSSTPQEGCSTYTKCPAGYTMFKKSCYRMVKPPMTWYSGRTRCQTDGGDLVTVETQEENDFLEYLHHANTDSFPYDPLVDIQKGFWIGGTEEGSVGTWRWVCSGLPDKLFTDVGYSHWSSHSAAQNPNQDCAVLWPWGNYTWVDAMCVGALWVGCEILL